MDDTQLQQQAHAGNPEAFTALAARCYPALCRHASYLVRGDAAAEDIVQEALLKAYLNIRKYDPQRSFSTWAYKIVTNCALDYLRKKKDLPLDMLTEMPTEEADPLLEQEDALARKAQLATLKQALAKLPAHYQAVVNLYYWEEKSYEEIATIMQKPLGTIKVWLFRAKRQLKEACDG
jgi:RNA polymerase sigma factor (sigma-70 family)